MSQTPASLARLGMLLALAGASALGAEPHHPFQGVRRVVFLGDSITYAGQYIEYLEAYLRIKEPALRGEFLNLGLPSETVSGLTEPGHAGGKFPRPDLHERLERVLAQTRPGLIVACYGMNDGIYYPFSRDRFEKYQQGLRDLRDRAARLGARVVHVTPPVFDPNPIRGQTLPAGRSEYRQPYVGYDEVLERYSNWLMRQKEHGWDVVDVHGPLKRYLEGQTRVDPNFRLADDGVHMDAAGHWIMARELLRHWGFTGPEVAQDSDARKVFAALPHGEEVLRLVTARQRILKDSWLSATGHRRPGMTPGLPLDEARKRAREIEAQIVAQIGPKP